VRSSSNGAATMSETRGETFAREGVVRLPQFFTAEEVDATLKAIQANSQSAAKNDVLDRTGLIFHHEMYRVSESIRALISTQKVVSLLYELSGADLWVRWDQAVLKTPGGVAFPWHQDNAYSRLPDEHLQLWIALTDMTPDNGILWVK